MTVPPTIPTTVLTTAPTALASISLPVPAIPKVKVNFYINLGPNGPNGGSMKNITNGLPDLRSDLRSYGITDLDSITFAPMLMIQDVVLVPMNEQEIGPDAVVDGCIPIFNTNVLLDYNNYNYNLRIDTGNYTIVQPLNSHMYAKSLLSTPGRGTKPYILCHTLKNNPNKEFKEWDACEYARKLYSDPNAGGKSMNSEAFSVNVLNVLYNIQGILTEMEVEYIWYNYKKCDYLCTIFGQQVGVSVTRAMGYPDPSYFTVEDADRLLKKKISGLMVARDGVIDKYNFDKCILHVWCESQNIADIIMERYSLLDVETRDDIIIILTVTQPFSSPFIYYDKDSKVIRERIMSESALCAA